MRAGRDRVRLSVRAGALLLALWLPAGPLLSSAAAATRAKPQCKGHGRAAAGVPSGHGETHVDSKPSCHGPARKLGCHGSSRVGCHGAKGTGAERSRACCCAQLAISAGRCGCRHDGGGTAVTVKNVVPNPAFFVRAPAGLTASPSEPVAQPDALLPQPPDPPPRLLHAHSFS